MKMKSILAFTGTVVLSLSAFAYPADFVVCNIVNKAAANQDLKGHVFYPAQLDPSDIPLGILDGFKKSDLSSAPFAIEIKGTSAPTITSAKIGNLSIQNESQGTIEYSTAGKSTSKMTIRPTGGDRQFVVSVSQKGFGSFKGMVYSEDVETKAHALKIADLVCVTPHIYLLKF